MLLWNNNEIILKEQCCIEETFNLIKKFEDHGAIFYKPRMTINNVMTEESKETISIVLVQSLSKSIRRLSVMYKILKRSVHPTVVQLCKFKAYILQLDHNLIEDDFDRHLQKCKIIILSQFTE